MDQYIDIIDSDPIGTLNEPVMFCTGSWFVYSSESELAARHNDIRMTNLNSRKG